MARERVEMHQLQELVRLHQMGVGARAVARQLRISPTTERRYRAALESAGLLTGPANALPSEAELKARVEAVLPVQPPAQQVSTAAPWEAEIGRLLEEGAGARAIHDWLRLHRADAGVSYDALKRACRRLRRVRGVSAAEVVIRVETAPGSVAQVDFGDVGRLVDPRTDTLRRAYVFVMVLGHSRHMFAKVVFDQKVATWLRLHVEAFHFFGGVPATIVPDNLKAAVVRAAFGADDQPALNRSYRELARHFGFKIDPTPPRSPEKKGKVEATVKYVKGNFFVTNDQVGIQGTNEALGRWVLQVAGQRLHGTTGKVPLAVFEAVEQAALLPLPAQPFEGVQWAQAKVHPDAHVAFDGRMYSVPWPLLGKQVWIRATSHSVVIFHDSERVATHGRQDPGPRSTVASHLPDHRVDYRHREPAYWVARAGRIGEETAAFVTEVFAADEELLQLRRVQGIVTYLERFPRDRAEAACRRARFYGNHSYRGIRDILQKALDLAPLPETLQLTHGHLPEAAYARVPVLPHPGPGGPDEYH